MELCSYFGATFHLVAASVTGQIPNEKHVRQVVDYISYKSFLRCLNIVLCIHALWQADKNGQKLAHGVRLVDP